MKFKTLVEEKKKELRSENIRDVQQAAVNNEEWLCDKIDNHLERFGDTLSETKEDVLVKIQNDLMVASLFAKDPSKQNVSEKMVAELLDIEKLPAGGANSVRFNKEGELVSQNTPDASKSADFLYNGIYLTQKYTRVCGGAQDNQRDDVITFLENGSLGGYKVGALVDGEYWDNNADYIKEYFKDNDAVSVLSMDDLI